MIRRLVWCRSALIALVWLGFLAPPAVAQTCLGAASLDHAPFQLGAGLNFSSTERQVSAAFTGGHDAFFGTGHANYVTNTTLNVGASAFGAGVGGALPTTGRVHLCSLADVTYLNGPDFGATATRTFVTTAGGQIGIVAFENRSVQIVPTVGAALRLTHATITPPRGTELMLNDHYGIVGLGVGLVVNAQLAVTATIDVPFALVSGETSFGLGLTYNFK